MTTDEETYTQTLEALYKSIGPRAIELLARVRNVCRDAGMATDDEPYDMSNDYRWSISVWPIGADPDRQEDCVDISVEIAEAREYGDEDSTAYGVNFGLDVVEWGGQILGGLAPYNYTSQCWVDARDSEAVEERWSILESSDVSLIPSVINRED